ncbi:hypothetical protein niasHT_027833 [Heterodera trifolii]|uniref:BZIP domain-containing protein n=1 Tax=Heterodera trifolii TaxID=157864 RepID=A0ABD2JSE4_9BILA
MRAEREKRKLTNQGVKAKIKCTAFASEFLTDAKNRLNAKIEEIEARILYLLARESKLNALNQLGAEIEREVNALENMFP